MIPTKNCDLGLPFARVLLSGSNRSILPGHRDLNGIQWAVLQDLSINLRFVLAWSICVIYLATPKTI